MVGVFCVYFLYLAGSTVVSTVSSSEADDKELANMISNRRQSTVLRFRKVLNERLAETLNLHLPASLGVKAQRASNKTTIKNNIIGDVNNNKIIQ